MSEGSGEMGALPITPSLSRRAVLGCGLTMLAAAGGCASPVVSPTRPAPSTPRLSPPGAETPPGSPATVASLLAENPFYIAHRGGGDDWPEMTAYAYERASRLPALQALEISVCRSADGVLVCSHDPTTDRMTGSAYTIADESWDTLSKLQVTAAYTRDPSQPTRPFSRFDEIARLYADRFVLFVEPKVPAAVEPLFALMASLGNGERVVWKQPINQPHFERAKEYGFTTWGYVLNEPGHLGDHLARFAADPAIDLLGSPRSQAEPFITAVVEAGAANGKRTIMWNIRNVADRDRALRLGCDGLMTSDIEAVITTPT